MTFATNSAQKYAQKRHRDCADFFTAFLVGRTSTIFSNLTRHFGNTSSTKKN